MIRGIVYLTGLATLSVVGLVAALTFGVHRWPWREYIESGRREVARTLDPSASPERTEQTASGSPVRAEEHRAEEHRAVEPRVSHVPTGPRRPDQVIVPAGPRRSDQVIVLTGPRRSDQVIVLTGPRRPDQVMVAAGPLVRGSTELALSKRGGRHGRHVVRRNETLYAIAQLYCGAGERWREIARANGICKPSDLRVGRVIVIPCEAAPSGSRGGPSRTVACEDGTDVIRAPDLRLQFASAVEGGPGDPRERDQ